MGFNEGPYDSDDAAVFGHAAWPCCGLRAMRSRHLDRDNEKENGNYYNGLYGVIVYWDMEKKMETTIMGYMG